MHAVPFALFQLFRPFGRGNHTSPSPHRTSRRFLRDLPRNVSTANLAPGSVPTAVEVVLTRAVFFSA